MPKRAFTPVLIVYLVLYGLAFVYHLTNAPLFFGPDASRLATKLGANLLDVRINYVIYAAMMAVALLGVVVRKPWGLSFVLADLYVSTAKPMLNLAQLLAIEGAALARTVVFCGVHVVFIILLLRSPQLLAMGVEEANKKRVVVASAAIGAVAFLGIITKSLLLR